MSDVGIYRRIDVRIHNDYKYRQLSDKAKLLFLTILTHPQMTSIGAMKATQAGLAEEMGWELEAFGEAFREVLSQGFVKYCQKSKFLCLPNFLKYNKPASPNVVSSWAKLEYLLPECPLRDEYIQVVKAFLEAFGEAFREAFREEIWKVSPNQEQEQEQKYNTSPRGDVVDGLQAADPSLSSQLEIEIDGNGTLPPDTPTTNRVVDGGNGIRFSPNDLARLWNETADPVFPRVILPLSERRARKLRPAIRDKPDPEWWRSLFQQAGGIPFLRGQNDRGWRADLEFVVRRWEEILEGKYCGAPKEEMPQWVRMISDDG